MASVGQDSKSLLGHILKLKNSVIPQCACPIIKAAFNLEFVLLGVHVGAAECLATAD